MQHDRGDRAAHAEGGRRDARCRRDAPVTVRRPRFSSTKCGVLEMFGDAVDAGAIADENRRLADLVLARNRCTRLLFAMLIPCLAPRAPRASPARSRRPPATACDRLMPRAEMGGEEAAEKGVARARRVLDRRRLRRAMISLGSAGVDGDAVAAARLDPQPAPRRRRASAPRRNPPRPGCGRRCRRARASAAARSGGVARGSALTAQTSFAPAGASAQRLARRLGRADRQAQHVGGGDQRALHRVERDAAA